ncbi:MAG: hypothetical protein ACI8RZ_003518 [Myxococcota bacterium]|jgi:hypothetical protein
MPTRSRFAGLLLTSSALLISADAAAHGLWGHIHVTGWAVENMPDDELRAFLLEPEVFNALLFGATFTDSGYADDSAASRAYSEHTHWEPFIEDFITWIQVNDPPPWTTMESKKRVAFLMGCASHGLQDTMFDSLFLYQVEEHDSEGQDAADPATDGFLVMDEHLRFYPEQDLPMEALLELYAGLDEEITEEVILDALTLVTSVYINDTSGPHIAGTLGESYVDRLPWTRTHYMDPEVPGSLRAEIFPTMNHQQALWARLHGELSADDVTVFAYPETPRRLLSPDHTATSSWSSLVFGAGVRYEDDLVELIGPDGASVDFTQANTRWGAEYTRLVRIQPSADLIPGGWYTARLRAGIETIDGQTSTQPWEHAFQVECDAASEADCEDLGEIPIASIDGVVEEPADTGGESEEGCGCASAGGGSAGLSLLVLLVAGRRRDHAV